MSLLGRLLRDQNGQAAYELGLLIGFIALSLQPALESIETLLSERLAPIAQAQTGKYAADEPPRLQPAFFEVEEAEAIASTQIAQDRRQHAAGPEAAGNYWPRTTSLTF